MNTFYTTRQYDRTGYIRKTATLMQSLADSGINASEMASRASLVQASNDLIANGEAYEMNVHYLNKVQLKLITLGLDSLNSDDQLLIETLAESCPFAEGNAVYTARTLRAMWQPDAKYDDRLICMQGQNKNSSNEDVDIDALLESQHPVISHNNFSVFETSHQMINYKSIPNTIKNNEVILYPNPAKTNVTIKYQCKSNGIFKLFNAVGQEVANKILDFNLDHVILNIESLPAGLYTYKCEFEGCGNYAGKLSIIKP